MLSLSSEVSVLKQTISYSEVYIYPSSVNMLSLSSEVSVLKQTISYSEVYIPLKCQYVEFE